MIVTYHVHSALSQSQEVTICVSFQAFCMHVSLFCGHERNFLSPVYWEDVAKMQWNPQSYQFLELFVHSAAYMYYPQRGQCSWTITQSTGHQILLGGIGPSN